MRRSLWLVWWLLAGICSPAAEPSLEFVHISDSHLMELAGVHPKLVTAREHYQGSGAVLTHVLERLAGPRAPAFILHTGDIVDAYCFDSAGSGAVYGQIETSKRVFDRSPVPVILALGNHDLQRYRVSEKGAAGDFSVAADARRDWRRMFPVFRDGTYYSFRKQVGGTTYRFLVLDNGEPEARNPEFYARQLNWMRAQVAESKEDRVILALHIPLGGDALSVAIKEIAARAGNVVLAIGGHRHTDAIEDIDLGTGALVQVRTAIAATSEEHTRLFRLFENRIEIAGTGHPNQLQRTVPVVRTPALAVGRTLPPWSEGTLDIHRISTGKGDAVLYIFPDGTTLLQDPGATSRQGPRVTAQRPDASRTPGEWVARYVQRFLPPVSGGALDYALLTHFHGDHMGDLAPDSRPARNGAYKLTGITDLGDRIAIRKLLDRGWPSYDYPAPLDDPMMRNYRAFLASQQKNRAMKVERFQPGRGDQVVQTHTPARNADFEWRNVAANGEIWTGSDIETRQHFPPVSELARQGMPSENMCSTAFRLRYGQFDYFCGGDIPGVPEEWAPPWQDVETPVAKVVGPVDVNVLNHHGYLDTQNAFFVATLRPRVHLFSVWSPSHPDARALRRLMATQLYPGPRDIFATNMMEANKIVIESLSKLKSEHGHIVVRVAPGGASYRVIILDDTAETFRITAIHGPYESR